MPVCHFCDKSYPAGATECPNCGAALPDSPRAESPTKPVASAAAASQAVADPLEAELLTLLQSEGKIRAIIRLREAKGCGLKEAKEQVEALAARHHVTPKSGSGCGTAAALLLAVFGACVGGLLAVLG